MMANISRLEDDRVPDDIRSAAEYIMGAEIGNDFLTETEGAIVDVHVDTYLEVLTNAAILARFILK